MNELFKRIRNTVISTTGSKISDKDIALIIYLYEQNNRNT